jgi:parallel beta-helix repeat protein
MTRDESPSDSEPSTLVVVLIGVVLLAGGAGPFIVDFGSATPEPVDFDDTVSVGLTLEDELRLGDKSESIELPRMQVFYSQYPYVVGYYGVESFVVSQREPTHERRFGFPTAVYVSDYADSGIELTERGLPRTDRRTDWVAAETAFYVIDSEARTPSGEAIIPFSTRDSAEAFVETYGGTVIEWGAVLEADVEVNDASTVRNGVEEQRRETDRSVETRRAIHDRRVGAVVGENGTTLQEAIDAAPPNTTVVVPAGTHEGPAVINRSVTLRGIGDARIEGDGNGTVLTVTAPRTAIVGLNVSGTGNETPGRTVTDDPSHHTTGASHTEADTVGDDSWDADVEEDYAQGDTAIAATSAENILISETEIHTSAAGMILYESPNMVVRNTTVVGRDNYQKGHMGIVAMRSPGVVENSTFIGGLDGVYTHRADGIVVRNNEMRQNRMGIHLMFTSGALLAGNSIRNQETAGIHVMTGPQRNAIVNNEVSESETGISFGGSDAYVAGNILTKNDLGLRIEGDASIVERNVIAENYEGVETWALLPTNRVTHNDFVDNERHVAVSSGRLRVWTHDGEGNYWQGAIGTTDGTVIQRPYTPTDPVDGRLHRIDGARTLTRAPALDALAGFEGAVPGMRADEVIDTAPLCAPVNSEWFERTGRTNVEPVCRSNDTLERETNT